MRFLLCFVFSVFVFSAQAIVLDWSGSYELELNTLQKGDFEKWGSSEVFHNLHLKPDIKAFDGVRIRSWFQIAPQSDSFQPTSSRKFYLQEGVGFGSGHQGVFSAPLMAVRDLYLEVTHDFGLFQVGWKPHHFGLGMYYNDSSGPFNPVYNLEGSKGFVSWRGFIGSAYYIQPMVHYVDEVLFNFFVQAGFSMDQYGVELMYKTSPQGLTDNTEDSPSYFGLYAYYKMGDTLVTQLEVGRTSEDVYGAVLDIDWQTPVKWLGAGLDFGVATSNEEKSFYFDPSFSSHLSFLIEEYEMSKRTGGEESESYIRYSFHSGFFVALSASFSLLDSLSLDPVFSTHLSYSEMDVLLYHAEVKLKYQLIEGVMWSTSVGVLFPKENNWHIGVMSQAAITF